MVLSLGGNGGPGTSGGGDAAGDVTVGKGPEPPEDPSIADISSAEVRREGDRLIFEATMASEVPSSVDDGSLEFRWDISEEGRDTWIVTASINVEANAAVTSQKTAYGSSTIDDSMPGSVEIDGDVLRVSLRADRIDSFPKTFAWKLKTTLDGSRADPGSGTATDSFPGEGTAPFG